MCDLCSNQRTTDMVVSELHKYNMGYPFERIAMDIGTFPMSEKENRHILVEAYYFENWCEAYPMPIKDVSEIAKVFVETGFHNMVSYWSCVQIKGETLNQTCSWRCVSSWKNQNYSTPPTVRWNGEMIQQDTFATCKVTEEHQEDWDYYIPQFMLVFWSSIHEIAYHIQSNLDKWNRKGPIILLHLTGFSVIQVSLTQVEKWENFT